MRRSSLFVLVALTAAAALAVAMASGCEGGEDEAGEGP